MSQRADYDPQATALGSAYVSAFNDYVRKDLHYGEGKIFKPSIPTFRTWNFEHQLPGQTQQPASSRQGSNVMPDLANAMKVNPNLKVQLNAGYFDLATPFYQGVYEMHHLPIPAKLQANIEYKFYDSGHMVYAKDSSLKLLHDNVAEFIRRTGNLSQLRAALRTLQPCVRRGGCGPQTSTRSMPPVLARRTYCGSQSAPSRFLAISTTM